jgi:hypothetical protein
MRPNKVAIIGRPNFEVGKMATAGMKTGDY